MLLKSTLLVALAALAGLASRGLAHPGEAHDRSAALREASFRHGVADINARALSQCGDSTEVRERRERAMRRRLETFHRLRAERGVDKDGAYVHRRNNAQFAKWAGMSHDRTGSVGVTPDSPHEDIFGANTTCILTPDNIIGPYYVLGEQIRSDIVEDQPGVPVHLEIQFVDVKTCRPTPGLFIDLWQCNATGVYSGVSAAGQGGLRSTYLRGVQETDADGVVEFDTIFPGHYAGRATHQHLTVHVGARRLPNNTYAGGTVSHISQLFFDQALVDAVERTAPYSANRAARTPNAADAYRGYAATAAYDPFPEYVLLSAGDLSRGIFMWLEVGFDSSANYDSYATVAAIVGPNGGVNNPGFNMGKAVTPPPTHG